MESKSVGNSFLISCSSPIQFAASTESSFEPGLCGHSTPSAQSGASRTQAPPRPRRLHKNLRRILSTLRQGVQRENEELMKIQGGPS
jgi:hypothetical protein